MNYECMDCGKEDFWTKEDTLNYKPGEGMYYTYPAFNNCPYCEVQICEDCYEKHKC